MRIQGGSRQRSAHADCGKERYIAAECGKLGATWCSNARRSTARRGEMRGFTPARRGSCKPQADPWPRWRACYASGAGVSQRPPHARGGDCPSRVSETAAAPPLPSTNPPPHPFNPMRSPASQFATPRLSSPVVCVTDTVLLDPQSSHVRALLHVCTPPPPVRFLTEPVSELHIGEPATGAACRSAR